MKDKDKNPNESGDMSSKKPSKKTSKKTTKKTSKKKVSKKTDKTESPLIDTNIEIDGTTVDEDQAFINDLLQKSINQYKDLIDREIKDQDKDFEQLQAIVSEFLDDFIIIGHTVDEKRVIIRYAPSPRSLDSLKEVTREYLMRMVMNDPLEGGSDDEPLF